MDRFLDALRRQAERFYGERLVSLITESNDLEDAGERAEAHEILMDLCQADLRCLDAHAHLGNFVFDRRPQEAIRHYEVGVRIGELSLGDGFEGVLPWGHIDNRPFLRCLRGHGLCLWRLNRFDEAARVFERMLWLKPVRQPGRALPRRKRQSGKPMEEGRDGR
jgi:tetratricopeptide (TPR) repeat protein